MTNAPEAPTERSETRGNVRRRWDVTLDRVALQPFRWPTRFWVCVGLLAAWMATTRTAAAEVPIVYSRCVRAGQEIQMSGEVLVGGQKKVASRTIRGFDSYDVLPDVTNFLSGFTAPCDLVYRDGAGNERVLYECSASSTPDAACAALDPAVSFDAKTIAFAVFRGTLKSYAPRINGRVLDPGADNTLATKVTPTELPGRRLIASGAQIHLVNVATGAVVALPVPEGEFDSGPAFLSNGRIAFTSTRDGNTTTQVWGTGNRNRGTRIWTVDPDGRNLDLASHHSLAREEHPYQLRDGRLAHSSWQIFGGLPFRHTNGTPGGFTTLDNLFHLYTQDPDGAATFAFYGQHSGGDGPSWFGATHTAAHFLTQTSDGRVWFADYYRGNNNGLGFVVGMMSEPSGQEGIGPDEAKTRSDLYAPRDAKRLTTWSTNRDSVSHLAKAPSVNHPSYKDPTPFAGKVGHPSALPGNGLMVSWGAGPCSTVASNEVFEALGKPTPPHTSGHGQGTMLALMTGLGLDTPACDLGVYQVTKIPSEHPTDLKRIVDDPAWHEIMARAVVPYQEIFNAEAPDVIARSDIRTSHPELVLGTPFGLLGAASMVDRETAPYGGIHFSGVRQFNHQGTDTINYQDDDICGVRILGVVPNRTVKSWDEISNPAGERVAILGEVAVRNQDANGKPVLDKTGETGHEFPIENARERSVLDARNRLRRPNPQHRSDLATSPARRTKDLRRMSRPLPTGQDGVRREFRSHQRVPNSASGAKAMSPCSRAKSTVR